MKKTNAMASRQTLSAAPPSPRAVRDLPAAASADLRVSGGGTPRLADAVAKGSHFKTAILTV